MAGNDNSFIAADGKRYTRGAGGMLVPVNDAPSGSGYYGGYTPDPNVTRPGDSSSGPMVKNDAGYVTSGGGWNEEQWKKYYEVLNNPNSTPQERQAMYMSRPDVAGQQSSLQANKLPQASADYNYWYGDPTRINPATGTRYTQGQRAEEEARNANFYAGQQKLRAAPQADFTNANNGALASALRLNQAYGVNADQTRLGQHLAAAALGQGPSVAELAMQRASAAEAQRNMAMAAGVGGPGAVSALINAQNRNSMAQGQLQQNLGVQRAAEQVQARTELGNLLNQQRGSTLAEAGQFGVLGQVAGQQSIANAGLQAGQNALNQQGEQYYYGQAGDWIKGQAQLDANKAQNWNNYTVGQQSNANNATARQQQHDDAILGASVSSAGALVEAALTYPTGGATAPAAVGQTADAANKWKKVSDIRAKTNIVPAGGAVSDAYRGIARADDQAGRIRSTEVEYPYYAAPPMQAPSEIRHKTKIAPALYRAVTSANDQAGRIRGADIAYPETRSPFESLSSSGYHYRDPEAVGAEPGQHFGPMAQELERTPAGASVVTRMPNGSKGIDTGRLALLNASETGQLRREVDALKGGGKTARLKERNDRKEAALARLISRGSSDVAKSLTYAPVTYANPYAQPSQAPGYPQYYGAPKPMPMPMPGGQPSYAPY